MPGPATPLLSSSAAVPVALAFALAAIVNATA
jgi:hypothetical protein